MPLSTPIGLLREQLGEAVLSRVGGGAEGDDRAKFFNGGGPRWFAAGSPITLVHGDAAMFIGGLRALLLQSLHPLAMAGVEQHSDYRADPWGRLRRTSYFLAATTYGPAVMAQEAVTTVRAIHRRVHGVAPDGRPYSAQDPHLLLWVHVAEVDSFVRAHRRYGRRPLDAHGYDEYVDQMAQIGEALGATDVPRSVAELRATIDGYRPELCSTSAARRAARFLLLQPPLPAVARPPYAALGAAAAALLPWWSRWPLRIPWLPVTEATVVTALGDLVTRSIRWAIPRTAAAVAD